MSEADVREHILLSDQVFLFLDEERIVGFSSIQFFHGVIYRYGTVIHPDYQNIGLYSRLNQEHFSTQVSMILRTQNLRIIDAHRAS